MSWLDALPSNERAKIRTRLRSPEAYQKLREKVKGPEDLEREMEKNAMLAELKFAFESEPIVQEKLKQQIEKDLREEGVENLLDTSDASAAALEAITSGAFTVRVETNDAGDQDQIVLLPEGNVAEKVPVKTSFAESLAGGLSGI